MKTITLLIATFALLIGTATASAKTHPRSASQRIAFLEKQVKYWRGRVRENDREIGILQDQMDDLTTQVAASQRTADAGLVMFKCFYGMPAQTDSFVPPGAVDPITAFRLEYATPGVWLAAINQGCLNGTSAAATGARSFG